MENKQKKYPKAMSVFGNTIFHKICKDTFTFWDVKTTLLPFGAVVRCLGSIFSQRWRCLSTTCPTIKRNKYADRLYVIYKYLLFFPPMVQCWIGKKKSFTFFHPPSSTGFRPAFSIQTILSDRPVYSWCTYALAAAAAPYKEPSVLFRQTRSEPASVNNPWNVRN